MNPCDVLVIGAGAAGMMCAFTAGQRGRRVVVLDHANRVGKKILMSGGGRCNFTNTGAGPDHYISANPHFCKSALARYTPGDFLALVERHRIAWHEKERGQLFCDISSKLIVQMLVDECLAAGVQLHTGCTIDAIERGTDGFRVESALGQWQAPSLVVATGGLSIPRMGASGFGHVLARRFGHCVQPTRPGLVPLTLSGRPLQQWQDLAGLSLPVEVRCQGTAFRDALLVTHRGLSGPAILQISSYWTPGADLRLDLLPGRDSLDWLRRARQARGAIALRTLLAEALPRRLAQRLCETGLSDRPLRQLDDAALRTIAATLANYPVIASGTEGYRTAEVTLGGVCTRELSSRSFESQRMPGLYFVGEVLDVTGWLGGYNFQWAWASGHAAGLAV